MARALLQLLVAAVLCASAAASATPPCPANTTADDILAGKNLKGQIAVVTGGDTGLGFAAALALSKRGATVVIGNHNATHGELAAKNISSMTGAKVVALPLNLGSLDSVRTFAKIYLRQFGGQLDMLVNNAGILGPSKLTADGYELVFQVDYLGHFLLTELLLPALRASAPSRIVNVASGAHENACETAGWPMDCFKDWTYLPPPVVSRRNVTVHYTNRTAVTESSSYGIAKFANVQHAAALAQREHGAGVRAFSLTPGFALTSMTSGIDPSKAFCDTQRHPDPSLPANPCPFSAEQGTAVVALCAAGDEKLISGAYYSRTFACETRPIVMQGFTEAMQHELYERSLRWVGLAADPDELVV
mmetsp:Transcript_82672/g.237617  ORF Transcript_82672/g.237617 Transcript_82672/m.237617 type:complete len:361 (-) Transcript_82672:6-1088(-)